MTLMTLRCQNPNCKKVLGKVDENGILITESKRSWIRTKMEKGRIECKKCGNEIIWNKKIIIEEN